MSFMPGESAPVNFIDPDEVPMPKKPNQPSQGFPVPYGVPTFEDVKSTRFFEDQNWMKTVRQWPYLENILDATLLVFAFMYPGQIPMYSMAMNMFTKFLSSYNKDKLAQLNDSFSKDPSLHQRDYANLLKQFLMANPQLAQKSSKINNTHQLLKTPTVNVSNLRERHSDTDNEPIWKDFTLKFPRHIASVGQTEAGKTTFAKCLIALNKIDEEIEVITICARSEEQCNEFVETIQGLNKGREAVGKFPLKIERITYINFQEWLNARKGTLGPKTLLILDDALHFDSKSFQNKLNDLCNNAKNLNIQLWVMLHTWLNNDIQKVRDCFGYLILHDQNANTLNRIFIDKTIVENIRTHYDKYIGEDKRYSRLIVYDKLNKQFYDYKGHLMI